jgi:glycosyltransferase involved in cell wall biosynthesis
MATAIVTVSSSLASSIHIKYGISSESIKIIPNGIDTSHYSPDQRIRMVTRKELHFNEDDFVIVFSGRLDPVKNFGLLLEVFEYCYKADSSIKLLVVGDGPERQKIEQICTQNEIDAGLVMLGQKSEVLPYLRAGDVFLLTSLTEQMPLTILEAMSVGLPVIASDVGEIRTIIDDGENGFLRNIQDGYEGFATAVLGLQQASNWQSISHAARSKIVRCFQESSMVQRYQTLIDSLQDHQKC